MRNIKMVDLAGQYQRIKPEIDQAIQEVLDATDFIQGESVRAFENELSHYLGGSHVISCGNGTDALQLAMMALNFQPGDEIILPVHTYVATAEVVSLLRLKPVFVDVHEDTFTINVAAVEKRISKRTVAIVPVHLYGQCAEMELLQNLASQHKLHVIEDAAQSLSANYKFSDKHIRKAGTIGTIGTTSFFPSKNLGAFGDGGAIITGDASLAAQLRMMANHGQRVKYRHDVIGVNSRLDTLQAAVLRVKLKRLDDYTGKRSAVANFYDERLKKLGFLKIPARASYSSHVFHQYTVRTDGVDRDKLRQYLQDNGIPTMIYYPIPLHQQLAYRQENVGEGSFPVTEQLSRTVLSLPIHTEMDEEQLNYICDTVAKFG